MKVLGIETSCDETAASIVSGDRMILSNIVRSQLAEHAPYGGIVPEIAARAHVSALDHIITQAMDTAEISYADLDAVAVTAGPGLIGGVIVGVMTAKAIALGRNLPFIAVNHLEGHALTARLTDNIKFPYLLLLVSGGHTQLLIVKGVDSYKRLGTTIDDAIGEAFDKTARMLGLSYPGGPAIEKAARQGKIGQFNLPRPLKGREGCNFSFSGLKTAVRNTIEKLPGDKIIEQNINNLCADFQATVADVVGDRVTNAILEFRKYCPSGTSLVVAGGVAANSCIRKKLCQIAANEKLRFIAPPQELCTDNAAMIAWAGLERLKNNLVDRLDFAPKPRWPLDPNAPAMPYAGVKS